MAGRESFSAKMERELHILYVIELMQTGRLTYWQAESLVVKKWTGICKYYRERGICRQAGLLVRRQGSLVVQTWRGICICTVGKGTYADRQAYRELHGEGSAYS